MTEIASAARVSENSATGPGAAWRIPRPRFSARVAGAGILIALALAFAIVPRVSSTPVNGLVAVPMQAPSSEHWFGTDELGRDVFVRVFAAGLTDLLITIGSVGLSLLVGTAVGIAIASLGPIARSVTLRLIDAVLAIPSIVLIMAMMLMLRDRSIVPFLPSSITTLVLAIVIVGWAPFARIATAQTLTMRRRESVLAARVLGYGRLRILAGHVAPALLSVSLSYAASLAVGTVGAISSLAFLGVGVQPPTPELGQMMYGGYPLLPVAWWIPIIPGLFVLLIGLAFALLADPGKRKGARS